MTTLSLREAAEQAGVSKSTVFRAIQSGRMSAPRGEDGQFEIQPAELFRVYPPRVSRDDDAERAEERAKGHDAPAAEARDATELRIRNAQLEAELNALRTVLETEKERAGRERERAEDLKAERDRWAAMAEAGQRQLTHATASAGTIAAPSWWPFRRRA